uniref:ATP-dependent DNA helicase n=1 Tax=Strongyloides venezuelensis TaxID=75913 RepID=A0A0K0FS09_STRVS
MSSAALIMACIKTPLNWEKFDINNVLNQENILYERCISHLCSTNDRMDIRDYLLVTNIIRETILFNRKVIFSTASCYSFAGRGRKVKRNEIAFGFVSLSEALNRIVNEYMFLILISNERASSIIHHDGAFFLFVLHSMDQNGRYCSKGVSCMLMFNTLVNLLKHLQANQVCNNSQFQLDGVNINIENLSDDNSDISTTRKSVKGRLSKIVRKKILHLSKNRNNKKVDSNLNEKTSLLKIKYDKCKRLSEKKTITVQLNRLENKSIDNVKINYIKTLKINKVVDNNSIKVSLINNEVEMEVDKCENDPSNLLINFDEVSEITDSDLNKNVIASNEEPKEIDISKNNISKDLIEPNVDVNSTFKQIKDTKVDCIVKALHSIQVSNHSAKKREKSRKSLKKEKLFPARNENIIPNEHFLGHLSTGCDHCQAMFYEKESKYKQCCEFGKVKEYERLFNNFPKFI